MLSIVSYQTYKDFAKAYKIPLSRVTDGKRKLRPISELKEDIRAFEKKHKIKGGLYY